MNLHIAAMISRLAHQGQTYRLPDGTEADYYDTHIRGVVTRTMNDDWAADEHVMVAYLHDVVEDTPVALTDLTLAKFPGSVVDAVDAISRREGEKYFDYVRRVKENYIGALVKKHDLNFNLAHEPNESMEKRYRKSLEILGE